MKYKIPIEVTPEQFEKKVIECCLYGRSILEDLEINYYDIREDDVKRLREYLLDYRYHIKKEKRKDD